MTGADVTEAALATAVRRAKEAGLDVEWRASDMRDLGAVFGDRFDAVVCCMALDNITDDVEIEAALRGMHAALKPGGRCYLRQRDFDTILRHRPRYDVKEERAVPHGRVIRLEDWGYESDTHLTCAHVFLREDRRRTDHAWDTTVFRYRRRALRKEELARFLAVAGFADVTFLPQRGPWAPSEVVASKPDSRESSAAGCLRRPPARGGRGVWRAAAGSR